MSIHVAVPVILARMKVIVNKGIHWNPVDWMLLWALRQKPSTALSLATEINLPRRIVIEIIWKLMRFGWVEMVDKENFRASDAGIRVLHIPDGLPTLEWLDQTTVHAVIEPTEKQVWPSSEVILRHGSELQVLEKKYEIRKLDCDGYVKLKYGELEKVAAACLRNPDEELKMVVPEGVKIDLRYLIVDVNNGECHGLPENTPNLLLDDVRKTAKKKNKGTVTQQRELQPPTPKPAIEGIAIDDVDILLDGASHLEKIEEILRKSRHRVIIHSTFLSLDGFQSLQESLRIAVRKGARIDILYGADHDESTRQKNFSVASGISKIIAADPILQQNVFMHMATTKSHAKLLLADTGKPDSYTAIVGSCNFLRSRFDRVEASIVLHDNRVIADILNEICDMCFAITPPSRLVRDLKGIAILIEQKAGPAGDASISLILGNNHGDLIRRARDEAQSSIEVGCDFFGQAGEVKTLIPLMTAGRSGIKSRIMFSSPKSPVSEEDLSDLSFLAEEKGVKISLLDGVLHGKFLIWDDNDVVITSLNWSSAGTRRDNPWGEIGIHIHKPGIGIKFRKWLTSSLEAARLARLSKQQRYRNRKRRKRK
ncbi:MAG: hypothetical protein DHS20C07_05300 [Methyloligella sp.]|nr:MAG: hypothetical protein DHS20C07_05300 [Methyloligella sp.]